MIARPAVAAALTLFAAVPAHAHRLDEYLQATTISIRKGRVQAQMRLTPGTAVFPVVFAAMDTDHDGVLSAPERRGYADRVLRDLAVTVDGASLPLRLVATEFADVDLMKEGRGDVQIDFDAVVPPGGEKRRLTIENHHQAAIAAYLVNALVPIDPDIRIKTQDRSYDQSFYGVRYEQDDGAGLSALLLLGPLALIWWRISARSSGPRRAGRAAPPAGRAARP
jgi:hypothetical protein